MAEKTMSDEIALQKEMECRRRVEEILNPKKVTADRVPLQSSYLRKNDQAPFGGRKLAERSTPYAMKRSFPATQNAWQRSNLLIPEKRQRWTMANLTPRSFISPPKPNATSWETSPANIISNPKPSASVPHQGANFCEVCKVRCSGPFNYKQHLEGRQHKNKSQAGGIGQMPRCDLCDIWCTDERSLQIHYTGRKHKAKMLI